MFCATFSIVARDPKTGHLGVGTASCALAVGAKVITVIPEAAAVASQSWASQVMGRRVAELCAAGLAPADALAKSVAEDVPDLSAGKARGAGHRQVAVIDAAGRTATYTGEVTMETAKPYAGSLAGTDYAVAGNLLTGADVLATMAAEFEKLDPEIRLARRILAVLKAGEAAGGDNRGKQAAAIVTAPPRPVWDEEVFDVDLRVDDHPDPLAELGRLLEMMVGYEQYL